LNQKRAAVGKDFVAAGGKDFVAAGGKDFCASRRREQQEQMSVIVIRVMWVAVVG